jgi:hypothetical protein
MIGFSAPEDKPVSPQPSISSSVWRESLKAADGRNQTREPAGSEKLARKATNSSCAA